MNNRNQFSHRRAFISFLIFVGVSSLVFILWSWQKLNTEEAEEIFIPDNVNYFNSSQKPLAVIFIHTCKGTFERIVTIEHTWSQHPLILNGTFKIELIVANDVKRHSEFPIVEVGCTHERIDATCRFQSAYNYFYQKYPSVPFLFSADDDIWLNLDNLYKYIQNLMRIYNPFENLVFKGHANLERTKLYFLHGGCGWLMSNCYIKFVIENNISLNDYFPYSRYRQPDTSQSIIVRRIFKHIYEWDEYHMQGFECKTCAPDIILNNNYELLPKCGNHKVYGRVNDIISFHTISWGNVGFTIARHIGSLPSWVLFEKINKIQGVILCKEIKNVTKVADWSVESLKKRAKLLKPSDIKLPLTDFSKLKDEHFLNY
ncbi:hypothetical protein TRFO_37048 [Tritrichomonas foetus]|uniref:Hexosyltransferase n=1 Tax=Tritrichomonas foetus TaxID=1144522 RepID=A0A1J4JC70_9EUKA|nr:hypothetical protein TRFO_37048 [Tritrichomonas foetus]|eukprot:OHS96736.1 hypothetical protein TRFO_37048 [Tritrichomonas foetus]